VAAARGRYLAFTDDDCRPTPEWLETLDRHLHSTPDRLIGGRTTNGLESNAFSTASQVIVEIAYAFYNPTPETATFFASNNLAAPKARFLELGGFDPAFRVASEDRELCDRWRHAGGQLLYAPDVVVTHSHALTFSSFARQHFAYGRGAHRYHRVREGRGSGRLRDDMRFHLLLPKLLRPHMSRLPLWRATRVMLALALWQIANTLGFFYEKYCGGRRAAVGPIDHAANPVGAPEARRSRA
jgi:GT2 family glycosyltransferase